MILRLGTCSFAAAALVLLLGGAAQADSFLSFYAKAQKAQTRHDDEAALQAWSNALRLWKSTDSKPKKAKALAARAALYEKKGDWEAAVEDLSGALKISAKDAVLFHRRGTLELDHDKVSEAISDFYKATSLKLDYAEAFFDRGRAYALQGDAEFAKEDFRTACHLKLQKACAKAGPTKPIAQVSAKSKIRKKAQKTAVAPSPVASSSEATTSPGVPAEPLQAAPAKAPKTAGFRTDEISVGSSVEEISSGETVIAEEDPRQQPPDFHACINRIASCSRNGDSYSACVSRARICEENPKQGCCPHDCVVLFTKLVNTQSEAEAFREVFRPKSTCLSRKEPKSEDDLDGAAP